MNPGADYLFLSCLETTINFWAHKKVLLYCIAINKHWSNSLWMRIRIQMWMRRLKNKSLPLSYNTTKHQKRSSFLLIRYNYITNIIPVGFANPEVPDTFGSDHRQTKPCYLMWSGNNKPYDIRNNLRRRAISECILGRTTYCCHVWRRLSTSEHTGRCFYCIDINKHWSNSLVFRCCS